MSATLKKIFALAKSGEECTGTTPGRLQAKEECFERIGDSILKLNSSPDDKKLEDCRNTWVEAREAIRKDKEPQIRESIYNQAFRKISSIDIDTPNASQITGAAMGGPVGIGLRMVNWIRKVGSAIGGTLRKDPLGYIGTGLLLIAVATPNTPFSSCFEYLDLLACGALGWSAYKAKNGPNLAATSAVGAIMAAKILLRGG